MNVKNVYVVAMGKQTKKQKNTWEHLSETVLKENLPFYTSIHASCLWVLWHSTNSKFSAILFHPKYIIVTFWASC